jgi:hypothetical protein
MCLDLLLPQIWTHHRTSACPFKNYQEMVEMIKLTTRQWNKEIVKQKIFKHVSTIFNVNINLIGFQNSETLKEKPLCEHKKTCYIPIYKFQNPIVKLVLTKDNYFTPLHIIEYEKKFYIFNVLLNPQFNPFLIKDKPVSNLIFAGEDISHSLIWDVLQSKPMKKPFSIVIYSAYSLVNSFQTKRISSLPLGFYSAETETFPILYVFISPHLEQPTFETFQIFQNTKTSLPNLKTIFSTTHLTEGEKVFQSSSNIDKDLLDQEFCICEHPDTKRFFSPDQATFNETFKNLGNI